MRALKQALNPWQQSGNTAVTGFTLVEMMVTVAVIAILAAIAVGRYDAIKVMAHRAEAKSNLGMIAKLQEVYRIERDKYYDQANLSGTANPYGRHNANTSHCSGNSLGFKVKGCSSNSLRYNYSLNNNSVNGYIAQAKGIDDAVKCNHSTITTATDDEQPAAGDYTLANGNVSSTAVDLGDDTDILYQTDIGETGLAADVLGCRD